MYSPAELEALGLTTVYFLKICCFQCGEFRGAVAEVENQLPCPVCHEKAAVSFLGVGATKKELPIYEPDHAFKNGIDISWSARERARYEEFASRRRSVA